MDETRDRIVAHVDHGPDGEARVRRAIEVRKALGIFGRGGQDERGFWRFAPVHAQAMFEYCYGIVWGQPLLGLKQRVVVALSALAALQLDDEVEWHVRAALNLGWTREEIVEMLTQLSPYIGIPRANLAFKAALRAFEKAGCAFAKAPENPKDAEAEAAGDRLLSQVDLHPDVKERLRKAFEVGRRIGIYGAGGQADDGLYRISPAHNQAILESCFGLAWNTPLLDMKTRELVVIAASTANQCDNELEWHVRSSLNAGLTRAEIVEAIAQCSPYIGLSKSNQGIRAAKRAFEALDSQKP